MYGALEFRYLFESAAHASSNESKIPDEAIQIKVANLLLFVF